MNAKNGRVIRDVFVLQNVNAAIFDVVVRHLGNGSRIGHTGDKQQRGENHAGFDGNSQVSKHGKRKRDRPYADVGLGEFEQLGDLVPLTHVVGHDH